MSGEGLMSGNRMAGARKMVDGMREAESSKLPSRPMRTREKNLDYERSAGP